MASKKTTKEDARKAAEEAAAADQALQNAQAMVENARALFGIASENARVMHEEANAEEIAAAKAEAVKNEYAHEKESARHRDHINKRHASGHRKETTVDPTVDGAVVRTATIDGHGHEVVSLTPLKLGHKGFGKEMRAGVRIKLKCGMSIDTPNDELVHERFDDVSIDCADCLTPPNGDPVKPSFNPPVAPVAESE